MAKKETLSLNDRIRMEAAIQSSSLNEEKIMHNSICKELVKLADENNFPMGVLVYISVGTLAHKTDVFNKGYNRIDTEKAQKIIEMCNIIGERFGERARTNDKIVHAVCRIYTKTECDLNRFKDLVANMQDFELKSIKNAKDFAKMLLGDGATYTKGGYVNSVILPKKKLNPTISAWITELTK